MNLTIIYRTIDNNIMKKITFKHLLLVIAMLCCVHERAYGVESNNSNAFGYEFSDVEKDSFPQITNIPTVYLQVYKTTYDSTTGATSFTDGTLESLDTIFVNKKSWYYKTKIVIRDDNGSIKQINEWTSLRGRGNATWNLGNQKYETTIKKPFRLKFPSKIGLLTTQENGVEVNNFAKAKSWTLLANHYDATMIHNAMAYEVGKILGLSFCPAYKFVDLVINDEYKGTYQISDQVQVGTGRVEIDESTGYFVEICSSNFKEDPWISVANLEIVNVKSPDPDIIGSDNNATSDPKYSDLNTHLNKVSNLAYYGDYTQAENWRNYVDVETAAKVFIAQEILGNYDAGQGNNYASMNDLNSKIYFGPIWDFDLAMNNIVNSIDMSEKHFWGGSGAWFAQYCQKLYENDPYFVKSIYEVWQNIYQDGALIETLQNKVDQISESISESATLNYTSTDSGGAGQILDKGNSWVDGNTYGSLDNAYTSLKTFFDTHLEFLDSEFTSKYNELDCANLQEISEEEADGPAFEETYTVTSITFNGWDNYQIPASAFNSKATSATVTVSNAHYIKFNCTNPTEDLKVYEYTTDVQTGEYIVEGDYLSAALNGYLYVNCDGNSDITVTVVNHKVACTEHDYTDCTYSKQDDGTYLRVCTVCGEEEQDGETYYLFTVYPESSTTSTLYATSWEPDSNYPNSIAVVNVTPGIEAGIEGYNIVNSTKNADYNQVCPDFRLTDGHPYYSDKKFVATKATYSRAMSNTWGTMILPYKYQNAETETANFYHLSSVETDDSGITNFVLTSIDPTPDTGNASAYTPVIFKKAENADSVKVTGTDITVKKSTADKTFTSVTGWTLKGVVEETNIDATSNANIYYVANNKFWRGTSNVKVNPFRAYVENTSGNTAASINIMVADEENIDAIEKLNSGTAVAICVEKNSVNVTAPQDMNIAIYNVGGALMGRSTVKAGETFSTNLPSGIYTINGVKVLVK